MARLPDCDHYGVTPKSFISEVQEFRAFVSNPTRTPDDKKRAYGLMIQHASMLDPLDIGYAGAGVALKHALCTWLDAQHAPDTGAAETPAAHGKTGDN